MKVQARHDRKGSDAGDLNIFGNLNIFTRKGDKIYGI